MLIFWIALVAAFCLQSTEALGPLGSGAATMIPSIIPSIIPTIPSVIPRVSVNTISRVNPRVTPSGTVSSVPNGTLSAVSNHALSTIPNGSMSVGISDPAHGIAGAVQTGIPQSIQRSLPSSILSGIPSPTRPTPIIPELDRLATNGTPGLNPLPQKNLAPQDETSYRNRLLGFLIPLLVLTVIGIFGHFVPAVLRKGVGAFTSAFSIIFGLGGVILVVALVVPFVAMHFGLGSASSDVGFLETYIFSRMMPIYIEIAEASYGILRIAHVYHLNRVLRRDPGVWLWISRILMILLALYTIAAGLTSILRCIPPVMGWNDWGFQSASLVVSLESKCMNYQVRTYIIMTLDTSINVAAYLILSPVVFWKSQYALISAFGAFILGFPIIVTADMATWKEAMVILISMDRLHDSGSIVLYKSIAGFLVFIVALTHGFTFLRKEPYHEFDQDGSETGLYSGVAIRREKVSHGGGVGSNMSSTATLVEANSSKQKLVEYPPAAHLASSTIPKPGAIKPGGYGLGRDLGRKDVPIPRVQQYGEKARGVGNYEEQLNTYHPNIDSHADPFCLQPQQSSLTRSRSISRTETLKDGLSRARRAGAGDNPWAKEQDRSQYVFVPESSTRQGRQGSPSYNQPSSLSVPKLSSYNSPYAPNQGLKGSTGGLTIPSPLTISKRRSLYSPNMATARSGGGSSSGGVTRPNRISGAVYRADQSSQIYPAGRNPSFSTEGSSHWADMDLYPRGEDDWTGDDDFEQGSSNKSDHYQSQSYGHNYGEDYGRRLRAADTDMNTMAADADADAGSDAAARPNNTINRDSDEEGTPEEKEAARSLAMSLLESREPRVDNSTDFDTEEFYRTLGARY